MRNQKKAAATTLQAKFMRRRAGGPVQRSTPSKRGFWLIVLGVAVIGLYLLLKNVEFSSKEAAFQRVPVSSVCCQPIIQNSQQLPAQKPVQASSSKKLK